MEGGGNLPDGAFERFVTSALAAIITIVFSWRLLAEGQEQFEGEGRQRFPPRTIQDLQNDKEKQENLDIPIDESVDASSAGQNLAATPPKYATLDNESVNYSKSGEGDPVSWGEFNLEEDMYDSVHTRRTARDFISKSRSSDSTSSDELDGDVQLSPIPASHEMLEKLYMNQEYRDAVDGESSDSSSDEGDDIVEGVYDTQNFEQDMYYATGLEPIMEEDSDDFSESDSSENELENLGKNNDTFVITSDKEPEGTIEILVKHQSNEKLTLTCMDNTACQDKTQLTTYDRTEEDNFIDNCFDNCIDENDDSDTSDSLSDKSDSLPPSPIVRTCAIDEEYANLSDESCSTCSSGSVITVVSVKSDAPEIDIVEKSNKPLSFTFTDNESSLKTQDIMKFIHGSSERLSNSFDPNKTPDNELLEKEVENFKPELDYADFLKDIDTASETKCEQETDNSNTPKPLEEISFAEHITENNKAPYSEREFDDDVGPREYNPYDDDFAEFEYCDSDDDSFYIVMGDSSNTNNNFQSFQTFNKRDAGNLRNFDTFDNLDAVGLSPALESPCESALLDDGRFIFSRTEEIGTEFHSRVFVQERDSDSKSTEKESNTDVPEIAPDVENKNSYNESLLSSQNNSAIGPIITELENIELFIDESKIQGHIVKNEELPSNTCSSAEIVKNEELPSNTCSSAEISSQDIKNSQLVLMDENNETILDKFDTTPLEADLTDVNGNSETINKENLTSANLEIVETDTIDVTHTSITSATPHEKSKDEITKNDIKFKEQTEFDESLKPCIEILSRAHDSGIDLDSESKSDSNENCSLSPQSNPRTQIFDLLHSVKGQINRSSVVKPSLFKGGSKSRIKQQQSQRSKSYVSVLQQPVSPEGTRSVAVVVPEKSIKLPKSRQQIMASRQKFLSEQNLSSDKTQEQFQQHKTSFEESARKPRYLRRGNSLPKSSRRHKSYDKLEFNSLDSSRSSSMERPNICTLHENCIFDPHKHQEILDRTQSIDNLESSLLRYGSVASLVETDIDSGETTEYQIYTDFDNDFEFQLPLQRTASMSDLATRIKHRKEARGQLSEKTAAKSKSLCTLETNIDDVFDQTPSPGTLGRVPSVHELRVSKSLQKLNVPDWYKKSSVSRSGSTWSLYNSPRKDSFSSYNFPPSITSSPCPSVSLGSNSVVIRTRVTPTSARLYRAPPKLQSTPEKSPTPITVQLPSDKFRQKEKPKELMPIPIVPFTKLRLMFETTSRNKTPSASSTSKPTPSPSSPVAPSIESPSSPVAPSIESPTSPVSHSVTIGSTVETIEPSTSSTVMSEKSSKPAVAAKPILKKSSGSTESKNVGRVEPQPVMKQHQQTTPISVQPMSTSPRGSRRVETTFNGTVGQSEKRLCNQKLQHDLTTSKSFPVLSRCAQHSDGISNWYQENRTLNKHSGSESFNKCNSLEDVLEGLLATDSTQKRSKSSNDIQMLEKTHLLKNAPRCSSDTNFNVDSDVTNDDEPNTSYFYVCATCKSILERLTLNHQLCCSKCYVQYCSHHCRDLDKPRHQTSCLYSRLSKLCRMVIATCNSDPEIRFYLSRVAKTGVLDYGKGCIKLTFSDSWSAESVCYFGISYLTDDISYLPLQILESDIHIQRFLPKVYTAVQDYNPSLTFIILVSIKCSGADSVFRCAKLRLSPIHFNPEPDVPLSYAMILSVISASKDKREQCFVNIQRKLREKGVNLRHHHTKIYRKLIDYVGEGTHFSPIVFYPFDIKIQNHFACIIALESRPKIEWIV